MSRKLYKVVEGFAYQGDFRADWFTCPDKPSGRPSTPCLIVPKHKLPSHKNLLACKDALVKLADYEGACFMRDLAELVKPAPAPYTPPDVELPDGWEWAGECRKVEGGDAYWDELAGFSIWSLRGFSLARRFHVIKQVPKES